MIETPPTLPNGVVLKNRIAKAAMTENLADPVDGDPNVQLSPFRATTHYLGAQMTGAVRPMRRPALPKRLVAET